MRKRKDPDRPRSKKENRDMTIRRPIKKEELKKEELAGVTGGIDPLPYNYCKRCGELFAYCELDFGYCKACAPYRLGAGGATGSW